MPRLTDKAMISGGMKKGRLVLFLCLVFLAGIAIASFLPDSVLDRGLAWFALALSSLAVSVVFWDQKQLRIYGLLGLFLFSAVWRYSLDMVRDRPDRIWHYNGSRTVIEGLVTDEPDEREGNTRLKIASRRAGGKEVSGTVLAVNNAYPRYAYGDRLELICRLDAPKGDEDFAYDKYLARFGIHSICYYPEIKLLARGEGNLFYGKIFQLKNAIRQIFGSGLEEPEAGLARGLILGDQKSMDKELSEKFSAAGLSHIVAISGSNISILSAFVMNLSLWFGLSRRAAFYFSSCFLLGYVLLVGAPASAIRAGLMGFLVISALYLGRLNRAANAVALAAVAMLVINPRLLRYDIGFQLSFLAIIGVSYLYSDLEDKFKQWHIPDFLSMREALAMTIAAQAFTIPVIIYHFSRFSAISILSNVAIAWTMPVAMILLPLAVLTGSLFIFGNPLFQLAGLVLGYIVVVADWSSRVPFASIEMRGWAAWAVIALYYAGLAWAVSGRHRGKNLGKFRF